MKTKLLVLMFILFFSCSSVTESEIDNSLTGTVIDEDGNAVENALIEIEYRFDYDLPKANPLLPQISMITIKFPVLERGYLKLWISNYAIDDTIKILIDDTLNAGNYSVFWDGYSYENKLAVSNVYQYHLAYQSKHESEYFMLLNEYATIDNPDTLQYYALTNSDGSFSIPYTQMAFSHGLEFILTDAMGNQIGTSALSSIINIWAIHKLYGKTSVSNLPIYENKENKVKMSY